MRLSESEAGHTHGLPLWQLPLKSFADGPLDAVGSSCGAEQTMRYDLSETEWRILSGMLPNKSRGVARVDDRRVLNGIFWVLRSGAPWRDLPEAYGPRTTCYNRFVRWRRAGIWRKIMNALAAAHDAKVEMIDTSMVRVHQHAACIADSASQSVGRSRGRADQQTACGRRCKRIADPPRVNVRRGA